MGFFDRQFVSQDMGIDLGTANTLIYIPGQDIVLDEPSVIAIDQIKDETLAVGLEAQKMLGRTPKNVIAVKPLKDGVITNTQQAQKMLEGFIKKVKDNHSLNRSKIVCGVPSGITSVEREAVRETTERLGAIDIEFIDEPVAAAIGAGLPIEEPVGSMIVDIGGGTTEVAVLSMQGTVFSDSVKVAGDELNESISQYMKKVYNLIVGDRTAEQIKLNLGSAYPTEDENEIMEVRGLHILSGLPRTITIQVGEIRESISKPLQIIIESIKYTLENTPPELAADIIDRGIMLAGGGALLKGLDSLISNETGIVTHIAPNPLKCVVYGTGKVLEDYERLGRVTSKKNLTINN